jgi:hypothetical protein
MVCSWCPLVSVGLLQTRAASFESVQIAQCIKVLGFLPDSSGPIETLYKQGLTGSKGFAA